MYADASPLPSERRVPFRLYVTTLSGEDPSIFRLGAVPLNWEQFEQMFESGVATVGAHTQSHPDLGFLSADIVAAEFDESNAPIQDRIGVEPLHFNYPKDWWSVGAEREVRTSYMRQPLLVRAHRTTGYRSLLASPDCRPKKQWDAILKTQAGHRSAAGGSPTAQGSEL